MTTNTLTYPEMALLKWLSRVDRGRRDQVDHCLRQLSSLVAMGLAQVHGDHVSLTDAGRAALASAH